MYYNNKMRASVKQIVSPVELNEILKTSMELYNLENELQEDRFVPTSMDTVY